MTRVINLICLVCSFTFFGCTESRNENQSKPDYVRELLNSNHHYNNLLKARIYQEKMVSDPWSKHDHHLSYALELLRGGKTEEAITNLIRLKEILDNRENLMSVLDPDDFKMEVMKYLGLAYLRLGEQENCIFNHHHSSCIIPISTQAVHELKEGSTNAISHYLKVLEEAPNDYESRYLLNLAYMTLGRYPKDVNQKYLIRSDLLSHQKPRIVRDLAMHKNLAINNLAGGVIADDFNNDGTVDLAISSWDIDSHLQLFINDGTNNWQEITTTAGLEAVPGGLNLLQTDYNNDGWLDIFVLRGGWLGLYGHLPNTLLRNEGLNEKGQLHFTDVTSEAGLKSKLPTQTATWADFNNDGWLDLYVGNESAVTGYINPSELYLNNQDGTFKESAVEAGVALVEKSGNEQYIVKGVTAGDIDNDGWIDLFVSTRDGRNFLFRNEGVKDGIPSFSDITLQSGVNPDHKTFTCWFWDYNNDGWLDLLVSGFHTDAIYNHQTISSDFAKELLNVDHQATSGLLYENLGNGTFADVSKQVGLSKIFYMMGGNFGDFNNDGWLDFYVGSGDPDLRSVIPNRMFTYNGEQFEEITNQGFGNIQKGHGAAFADFDQDGDQDIYMVMGGFYQGDVYPNIMLENLTEPGNHYLKIKLTGTVANASAIGARIKVCLREGDKTRKIFRTVNSGGSFGASSFMQHLGVGPATRIDTLEITWPGSGQKQFMMNLAVDQTYSIREKAVD